MECINCKYCQGLFDSEGEYIEFCTNTEGGNYLGITDSAGYCDWQGEGERK